jgi:hypothetical protein
MELIDPTTRGQGNVFYTSGTDGGATLETFDRFSGLNPQAIETAHQILLDVTFDLRYYLIT